MPAEDKKLLLMRYRNEMIAWIVLFAITFSIAHEFTQGWIAPIISYLIFMIGFIILMLRQLGLLNNHSVQIINGQSKRPSRMKRVFCYTVLVLSLAVSVTATVAGLMATGRITW